MNRNKVHLGIGKVGSMVSLLSVVALQTLL